MSFDERQPGLWDELSVDTLWVHLLRGTPLDDMGINAIAVYVMLKTYTNLGTGRAWPGVRELATRLKCSPDTVERALRRLEELNVIQRERVGRHNEYTFYDTLPLTDRSSGEVVSKARVQYVPIEFERVLNEIKDFARQGVAPGSDRLNVTINVTLVNGDNNVVLQNVSIDDPRVASDLRERFSRLSRLRLAGKLPRRSG